MLILLRKFVSGTFGLEALFLLPVLPMAIYRVYVSGPHNAHLNIIVFFVAMTGLTLVGALFAAASWAVSNQRASARGWGFAASLLNILISLPLLYYRSIPFVSIFWLIPISGISGMYLFSRWAPKAASSAKVAATRSIPGDGTNVILNKLPWFIGFVGGVVGLLWCFHWCATNDVPRNRGLLEYAQITLTLLIVTLVHELGHAIAAWGVGMKIRAFVIGPFQFRIREVKWGFQFDLAKTFSANGAVGAVHTNPHQPVWCDLFMIVAGPLANLATGTMALCIVFLIEPDSPLQAGGMLFLFGIYSFLACATNLIPFRSGEQYSDGAKIYQLLAGGPFADLHGALSVVASSLVTPLRPRDYNIELMERAAAGSAAQGKQLMVLFLFRYQHFLDCGQISEAALAMTEAEAIYHQYASEIPAELHTGFVFGNAYVKRDARGAREWWQRMEEKKPTRLNADYWLARSALHWIEGDLYVANDSWHKGAAIANQLPKAGAYEFDRYEYFLLRQALDESSSRNQAQSSKSGAGGFAFQIA